MSAITPAIDFSTFPDGDGEPMAETPRHRVQMTNLIFALQRLLSALRRVYVGGNMLAYYNPASGWDHVSPDVFVAFDVEPGERRKWETWEENGHFPDIVFEISSPSTEREDRRTKPALYSRLGVREYYIFDPYGELQPAFQVYGLINGLLQPVEPQPRDSYYSALLSTELRIEDHWLRVIDPATGLPIPVPDELDDARLAAEQHAALAEQRAALAEQRAIQEAEARATAEAELRIMRDRLKHLEGGAG